MQNWVNNHIVFPSEEVCASARNMLETYESAFDLNMLAPMPEELNISESSIDQEALAYYCDVNHVEIEYDDDFYDADESLERAKSRIADGKRTAEEYLALGERIANNILVHGYPTWYRWRCENWGTEWLPSYVEWDDNSVSFLTTWSAVHRIVQKLAEKLGCALYYEWADEDCGYVLGELIIKPGEDLPEELKIDLMTEYKIAARLWDESAERFRFDPDENEIVYHRNHDGRINERFDSLPVIDISSDLLRTYHSLV